MNNFTTEPAKIVSWTEIYNLDTLIQFYINCYNYFPELFIVAGILSVVGGFYVAIHRKEIMYKIRIFIMLAKMYRVGKRK